MFNDIVQVNLSGSEAAKTDWGYASRFGGEAAQDSAIEAAGGGDMKLFTIGYGGRRPEDFATLLSQHGVQAIVDVRLRPDRASMGAYVRATSADKGIQRLLASRGIEYAPRPELGNLFLECDDWQQRYRDLLQQSGQLLTGRLSGIREPFCLLCAERDVTMCHRLAIADFLFRRGYVIEHIA